MGLSPEALQHRLLEAALRRVAADEAGRLLALRGSLLTRAWLGPDLRRAEDIDFIGLFPSDPERAEALLRRALAREAADGVRFDPETLRAWPTWEETDAPGLRVVVEAALEGARREVQLDVGFGDPMDPPPAPFPYPAEAGPIEVLAVRPETAVAWKLHGLFEFPNGRWRPKDLWDLRLMLEHVPLDPEVLGRAIHLAFTSRHTHLGVIQRLLDGEMGHSRSSRVAWRGFLRDAHGPVPEDKEPVLTWVAERLREDVSPLIHAELRGDSAPELAPGRRFPRVTCQGELMAAILGQPLFRAWHRGGFVSLTYELSDPDAFKDPEQAPDRREAWLRAARRECRGICFDAQGRLLARKLHRFFHVGEHPEATVAELARWPGLIALPKLDGSLLTPMIHEGALVWTTRRGPSPLAEEAGRYAAASEADYAGLNHELHAEGFSLCFEWCSATHHLVVRHVTPSLVLLVARHRVEGFYLPHDALVARAKRHGVPVVTPLPAPLPPLEQLIAEVKGWRGREGLILRAEDGRMAKLKSDWYRRLHACVEHPEQERPLWATLLHGDQEALLPLLREPHRQAVLEFAQAVRGALEAEQDALEAELARARPVAALPPEDQRRALAALWNPLHPDRRALLFQAWTDGTPLAELIHALALRRTRSPKGLARLRAWLHVPDWTPPPRSLG
ncbi:MAG: nucleotidyl transferase AbiEii/AbiGii toxin family protein [Alphaproteobacteria bacterium]|nr:nucleotidyl transferase AbiEii/AbiGii toxin family protein [Alphaproteobacteria bacterium]